MKDKVTILLPVSRPDNLDKIFALLELLDCKREHTNLLVIVDGPNDLFLRCRNFVEMSKFAERLCVQFTSKFKLKHFDLQARRLRISDIHNLATTLIVDCDYVFGLEDDTIFPTTVLKRLLQDYQVYPYAGMIEGVQIARHGIPHVGAWKFDDIYHPTEVTSLKNKTVNMMQQKQLEEIDAGGLYCFLTTRENYVTHEFQPFGRANVLGPDVDFGLMLRRAGYLNYIDWSIPTVHKSKNKDIDPLTAESRIVVVRKTDTTWRQQNHI